MRQSSADIATHYWRNSALLVLLLLLLVLVYWPGLNGGYVFDDFSNIVDNTTLHVTSHSSWAQWIAAIFSSPASDLQRPLAMLSFAINHALTGLDPFWMKLTNLGIHLLNTWLVFNLIQCVLQAANRCAPDGHTTHKNWMALWVAAAWALNPINLTCVLFVVQRMESLCHTFVFAGLWLYVRGRERLCVDGVGWPTVLIGLVGGTAFGLLVKESAVLLPLYGLAVECTVLGFATSRDSRDRRLLALYGGVLVLPAIVGLGWLLPKVLDVDAYAGRNFNLGERLLTEGRAVVDYLHWTLLPSLEQLSLYHDDYPISHGLLSPATTLSSLLLVVALLGAMVWLRKRNPLMALGLAWFFAAHLLTATVIPLELMFEHRNYFASLGLCLALGNGLLSTPQTQTLRRAGFAAAVLLLALYAGLTALRAREWQDPMRFSLTEVAKHPQSPRASYGVARTLILLSGYSKDSPYLDLAFVALKRAMAIPAANILPETAAITLAARTGKSIQPAWWSSLQQKLRSSPIGPQETGALDSMVECEIKQHCPLPPQDMVQTFLAALERGPNAEVLSIYGNYTLNVLDDPKLTLQLWQAAAQHAPNVALYHISLAKLLISSGQLDAAADQIAQVRRLGRLGQNEASAEMLVQLSMQSRRGTSRITHPSPSP